MSHSDHPPGLYQRYLALLGVAERPPGMDGLTEIVRAHLLHIPFENVSKLYRVRKEGLRTLLPFEKYLDGIGRQHFGGTCYTANYYLNCLLNHLGYDARLCGADMKNPDVHMVNIVTLGSREYIVDVGYAAPFFEPLPRDLTNDYTISFGTDRYVLHPQDGSHRSRLDQYKEGKLQHGYVVRPEPRHIEYFARVIADSFSESATFMNALLLVRFRDNGALIIRNMTVAEVSGQTVSTTTLASRRELLTAVTREFGISPDIVEEALTGMQLQQDAWD